MLELAKAGSPIRLRLYGHYDVARYGMPTYQTRDSACFDFIAALGNGKSLTLAPGATVPIATGLGLEPVAEHPIYHQVPMVLVPELYIRSRSGLAAKFGVHALGGVIDFSYPDEMKVILHNGGAAPFVVEDGMRIAQGAVQVVWRVVGAEVAGAVRVGGLGSTGA